MHLPQELDIYLKTQTKLIKIAIFLSLVLKAQKIIINIFLEYVMVMDQMVIMLAHI
jgi:hypothetical protein